MPNNSDVRIGAPDQKVTGAIKHAPIGTTLPSLSSITKAAVTIDEAFTGDEYVSEDGLTLAPSVSTTDIKDWSGATVRKVLESFDGTLNWTMISTNEGAMGVAFGAEHVTVSAATATHGAQTRTELGAHLPERQSWVFLMKDGDNVVMLGCKKGQVTELGDVTMAPSDAITWTTTIKGLDDGWVLLTDDGTPTT